MTQAALAAKLVKAGQAIDYIAKNGTNDFHKYSYVTDADVLNKVRDALLGVGIATLVDVAHVEHQFNDGGSVFTTVQGSVSFIDSDTGETAVTGFAGTGTDKGDKGYYKAVTGGIKYALLKSFLIPTGDDPEVDTAESKASSPAKATGPKPPAAERIGLTVDQIKLMKVSMKEHGLETQGQMHAFAFMTVGKNKSAEMTSSDLDKILTALSTDTQGVENAKAVA